MHEQPVQPPSARVRLEAAFLDDEEAATSGRAVRDAPARFTLLVVAPDVEVRRYVGECLRTRSDLRLLDAPTTEAGVALATHDAPDLIVVEESEQEILLRLTDTRAVVMVDDLSYGASIVRAGVHTLTRPFSAEQLLAAVGRLLT
jgi:hypothetical protein